MSGRTFVDAVAMILRTTLIATMLVALGFIAFGAPTASAACIDANPDDNGVGTQGCNLPVAGNCKVLVYGSVPGTSCSQVQCVTEPCW